MFTVAVPGMSGTAVLRVGGRRGVPSPASGPPTHSPFPAAPQVASSVRPPPRRFSASGFPTCSALCGRPPPLERLLTGPFPVCALPACGFCFVQPSTVTVNQGTFFPLCNRGPGSALLILPCSSQHFTAGTWQVCSSVADRPRGLLSRGSRVGQISHRLPFPGLPGRGAGVGRRSWERWRHSNLSPCGVVNYFRAATSVKD